MKLTLNLASRTYLNRRKLFLAYALLAAALLLILAAQLNFCYQAYSQRNLLQGRLAELEAGLGLNEGAPVSDDEFRLLLDRISFSNSLIAKESYRWTDLLGQLEKLVPDEVRITQIRPNFKDGTLSLTGQAKSVKDLRNLLDRFFQSAGFQDTYLLRQNEIQPRNSFPGLPKLIEFSLVVKGVFK